MRTAISRGQWQPQTAVSPSLGPSSVAKPLGYWTGKTRVSKNPYCRGECKAVYPAPAPHNTCAISTQSSSAHVEERDQELWGTLEQDCLWLVSAKNNKSVSDWSIQVCTRAVDRAAYLSCEWVFPSVKVNTTGRWATPTYSWFLRFQNNICTTD